jgi:hypothetical protein
MIPRKRAREDEDIQIRVAEGEPLAAEACMLRTLSSCAKALPADAEEWDVSGLMFDGQPFNRETVSCWLNCARSLHEGLEELGAQDIQQLSTVTGLTQVLAFADAVGSRVGLCRAACSQLQQLKFVVQLPGQVLELPVAGCIYKFTLDSKQLAQSNLHSLAENLIGDSLASAEQSRNVQQQVAKQTAALLHLAHVLRLQPLLDVLHDFLLHNVPKCASERLLSSVAGLVFTDAVLEAALGSSTLSKEAYIGSVVARPCSLTPGRIAHSSLFKPIGPKTYNSQKDLLCFDAELLRDFAGGRAGDTVTVKLYLFDSKYGGMVRLKAGTAQWWSVVLPAQLLLGCSVSDAAALEDFLRVNSPA